MSDQLIGLAGEFCERRVECDASIERLADSDISPAKVIERLRRQFGSALSDLVVTAARLQAKARNKLGPGLWWVTDRSLQQATAWQVARLKSQWFGDRQVHDLCCGIGGDAIPLARRGPLVAIDSDPLVAALVTANLTRHAPAAEQASVRCIDAQRCELPDRTAVHIDPDRRSDSGRATRADRFQPSWVEVGAILARSDCAVIKLAPATRIEHSEADQAHRCWISLQGTVREQSLLRGEALSRAGLAAHARSAVALNAAGEACWFAPDQDQLGSGPGRAVAMPQSVLIDPDPAIRAAGLCEAFAHQNDFQLIGSPSGFLTCDRPDCITPETKGMAAIGNVVWTGACDDRKLRRELRARGYFPQTVKVRGADFDPARLVKRYRCCGDQPITLWIGRAGDRIFAAFAN